ncbi:protein BTG2-like [Diachasmimorpha longicaudata]|uniref:protein BTG2-like n=1 Tax=Diachasmimorpha longicaudata TaxID=58733 RepID=UPI0030B8DEF2
MKLEIISAADFLVQLLRLQAGQLSERQLDEFKSSLSEVLRRRYRDHWFPDRPNRGSGYRCLRINGKMDPVIALAGRNVGLLPTVLHTLFPSELTMWIDPAEVSYRIGENGSICVLYERTEPDPEEMTSRPSSSSSSVSSNCSSSSVSSMSTASSPSPASHSQQQQYESCKDSLIYEHTQFNEQIAAFVSS